MIKYILLTHFLPGLIIIKRVKTMRSHVVDIAPNIKSPFHRFSYRKDIDASVQERERPLLC
jgi:hypothetical protein